MPISLRAFNDELEPGDTEVLRVLEQQPYQAYTLGELTPRLESDNVVFAILGAIAQQSRIQKLVARKLIRTKTIRGQTYYVSAKARPV